MIDLDRQVAEKEGWHLADSGNVWVNDGGNQTFEDKLNFTTDWSLTGPLIEKYQIELSIGNSGTLIWRAHIIEYGTEIKVLVNVTGETPLIAACRAIITIEDK